MPLNKTRFGVAVLAAFVSGLLPAGLAMGHEGGAEPAPHETVLLTITPEQVVAVLQDEGYADARAHEPQRRGAPSVTFTFEGHPVSIIMDAHGHWLQSYSAWSEPRVDAGVTNEWNRTSRFSRAYFDKQNRAVLETDLDLSGGVTLARVYDWVHTHDHRHRAFVAFLHEHADAAAAATAPATAPATQPGTQPADG